MNKLGLAILGVLGFVVLIGVYYAFVLSTLWAWFVVPLGVAKIGMAHAYGLSLIPSVVLGVRGLYPPEEKKQEAMISTVFYPAISLLFGWIALSFI